MPRDRTVDPALPSRTAEALARLKSATITPALGVLRPINDPVRVLTLPPYKKPTKGKGALARRPGKPPAAVRDEARHAFHSLIPDLLALARGAPVEVVADSGTVDPDNGTVVAARTMLVSPTVSERIRAANLLAKYGGLSLMQHQDVTDPLGQVAELLGVSKDVVEALVAGGAVEAQPVASALPSGDPAPAPAEADFTFEDEDA